MGNRCDIFRALLHNTIALCERTRYAFPERNQRLYEVKFKKYEGRSYLVGRMDNRGGVVQLLPAFVI